MKFSPPMTVIVVFSIFAACCAPLAAEPVGSTDLALISTNEGLLRRVLGSSGQGAWGVPVSGGHDVDLDGFNDYAFAAMRASPQGRQDAGEVFLVFGDGTTNGLIDTAFPDTRVLTIHGDQIKENAGSEIWMADVTGDGRGDLMICRQNYSHDGRTGSGALTLIPGQDLLRTMAVEGTVLDLRTPPPELIIIDIYGAMDNSRLCIWARSGDVTGDLIDDFVVGADRERHQAEDPRGMVYLFRGGNHFESSRSIDLAQFGTVEAGRIARFKSKEVGTGSNIANYHLGATVQIADLDGNGRAEVLAAAALNRIGASLPPNGGSGKASGGTPDGTIFIAWDDNFAGDWVSPPVDFTIDAGPGSYTIIDGSSDNDVFGEEMLGGLDYDNDGRTDLFSGDLTADGFGSISRSNAGLAQVIYDIASYRNQEIDLDSPPPELKMATFVGPVSGAISGDTALHGDFNGDGIDDLAFSSPHDGHFGRNNAGTLHIVLGQTGQWPELSDLRPANFPTSGVDIYEIYGANGARSGDNGDVLCYSGDAGDLTGDGVPDLIINEMQGNGSTEIDVGNLILIDSKLLFHGQTSFRDGFE
jgi:hypothetical protein